MTTPPLRALIAEDESLLAAALKAELARIWPELEIAGIATNGVEALRMLQTLQPDVAFLDIRMPGMTGLEVAQAVAEDWPDDRPAPMIVFVTAYDEFAVKAFEQAAVDYLLKPATAERLKRTRERIEAKVAAAQVPPATGGTSSVEELAQQLRAVLESGAGRSGSNLEPLRIIRAGVGETVRMIGIEDVIYFEATDKYVNVVTRDSESLIREPLKEIIPRIDPQKFVQIHRSTVVNILQVTSATRDENGKMTIKLRDRSETLVVSRLYAHLFRPM